MNVKLQVEGKRCRVIDAGREIMGIYSLVLKAGPGTLPKITIEALPRWFEADGELVYNVAHPVTGSLTEVRSITFADGTVWPLVEEAYA